MANQININRPTTRIVIISVILAILALIGHFSRVQFLTEYQFWLAMIAYVALLLRSIVQGPLMTADDIAEVRGANCAPLLTWPNFYMSALGHKQTFAAHKSHVR